MTSKDNKPVPTGPVRRLLTAAERRAAQVAEVADKQAQLKSEAAERRARRAENPG